MSSPSPSLLLCSLLCPQWMVVFDPQDSHPVSTPGQHIAGGGLHSPGSGCRTPAPAKASGIESLDSEDIGQFPLGLATAHCPLPPWPKDAETLELGG